MTKRSSSTRWPTSSALARARPRRPSTPCSRRSRRRLTRGGEINFTGFGKFSVADRGARQGVNPQTGERIQIAASRVPRFSAGLGAEEGRQGQSPSLPKRTARGLGDSAGALDGVVISPTGSRRSWRSAAARSCSVSTRTRPRCGRRRVERRAAGRTPRTLAREPHRRGGRPTTAARRSRRPGRRAWRSSRSSPASSASARPGWEALEQVVAAARDARPARARRRQARRRARSPRAPTPRRWWATTHGPFGPVAGPRRRRLHRQPAARAATRSSRWSTAARAAGAGCFVPRAHLQPRRRRAPGLPASAPLHERLARARRRARARPASGDCGLSRRGRGHRRHPPGAARPAARADAARDLPAARRRRPGRPGRGPRRRPSRPHPAAGLVTASRSIVERARRARRRPGRRPPRPRPRSCGPPPGSL